MPKFTVLRPEGVISDTFSFLRQNQTKHNTVLTCFLSRELWAVRGAPKIKAQAITTRPRNRDFSVFCGAKTASGPACFVSDVADLRSERREPTQSDGEAARRFPHAGDGHPGPLVPERLRRAQRHRPSGGRPAGCCGGHHLGQGTLHFAQQVRRGRGGLAHRYREVYFIRQPCFKKKQQQHNNNFCKRCKTLFAIRAWSMMLFVFGAEVNRCSL